MNNILEIKGLSCNNKKEKIIENISFSVASGSVQLLLGSNGAGKTTIIECIIGSKGFEGNILIGGFNNNQKEAKSQFSYVPDEFGFPETMTVLTFLRYMKLLNGVSYRKTKKHVLGLLRKYNFEEFANHYAKDLSLGQLKKLNLIQGVSEKSNLIILDEPLNSLDITMKHDVINVIKSLKKQGVSFLISTHSVDFFEAITDAISIVHNKRIIFSGPVSENITNFYLSRIGKAND